MLHTFDTRKVVSKREAGEWALGSLDQRWRVLIEQALSDRPDPWSRYYQPATAESAAGTLAFIDYALTRTAKAPASDPDPR
jgi:hypothetical protein